MKNPKYEQSLHYIKGNVLSNRTLKLAKLASNKVFILCDQYSTDSDREDTNALLFSKSIYEYDHSCSIYV